MWQKNCTAYPKEIIKSQQGSGRQQYKANPSLSFGSGFNTFYKHFLQIGIQNKLGTSL